jgi:hypothetical protein
MIGVFPYRICQCIILIAFLLPMVSFSTTEILVSNATSKQSVGFIENKVQILDQNNNPNLADGDIPNRATLSIDPLPDRVWGTYFGGTGMEWIGGCVVHKNGDIILYGMTNSPANIATAGAHQTVNMGNMDAFLAKFDKDGVIQ